MLAAQGALQGAESPASRSPKPYTVPPLHHSAPTILPDRWQIVTYSLQHSHARHPGA